MLPPRAAVHGTNPVAIPSTSALFLTRSPTQESNHLTGLREFCKMYAQTEGHFAGSFREYWPMHHRKFTTACEDFDVPTGDRGHFLLLSVRGGAVHHLMEVVDRLVSGKRDCARIHGSFYARYASLTRKEEASAVLDGCVSRRSGHPMATPARPSPLWPTIFRAMPRFKSRHTGTLQSSFDLLRGR